MKFVILIKDFKMSSLVSFKLNSKIETGRSRAQATKSGRYKKLKVRFGS